MLLGSIAAPQDSARLALDLSDNAVALYAETSPGNWLRLGEAWLDGGEFDTQIAELREVAVARRGTRSPITLWMPPEQVLTLRTPLKSTNEAERLLEAAEILDSESVYKPGYLSVAASTPNDAGEATVLAALTQSCDEARAHARGWGFVPGTISTRHDAEPFGTEGPVFRNPLEAPEPVRWPFARVLAGGAIAASLLAAAWLSADHGSDTGISAVTGAPVESFYALNTDRPEVALRVEPAPIAAPGGQDSLRTDPGEPAETGSDNPAGPAHTSPAEPTVLSALETEPHYRLARDYLKVGNGPQKSVPPGIQDLALLSPNGSDLPPAVKPFIDLERVADPVIASLVLDLPELAPARPSLSDQVGLVDLALLSDGQDAEALVLLALAPATTPEPPAPHAPGRREAVTGEGSRVAPAAGVPMPLSRPAEGRRTVEHLPVRAADVMPVPPTPEAVTYPALPSARPAQHEARLAVVSNTADPVATGRPISAPRGSVAPPGAVPELAPLEPAPASAEPSQEADAPETLPAQSSPTPGTAVQTVTIEPAPITEQPAEVVAAVATPTPSPEPAAADPAVSPDPQPAERREAVLAKLTAPNATAAPPKRSLPKVRTLPKLVNRNTAVSRRAQPEPVVLDGAPALVGVLNLTTGRQALIRLPNGRFRRVAVGDELDGWKVSAIGQRELRLNSGAETITLPLISR